MGKSPGKWIKTVLFGKKSSKSDSSKDGIINKKTSITSKPPSKDFDDDSMVISSPIPLVMHMSGEHTELEKTTDANRTSDTIEVVRSTVGLNTANEHELIKLDEAATKAQAAFRGYLARRAFFALKGIIRLQAQVRGRLVRRQAVATLSCMRAIVELQALARGRRVRKSDGSHMLRKYAPGVLLDQKQSDLLGTSLRSEKLSTNAFCTKLVASSNTTMPLRIRYDPSEPNSIPKWLHRWSSSRFWEPLPRPKKTPDSKPKRKPTKSQPEEPEIARVKRSVRRVPAANLETKSSENEKPKPPSRKTSTHQPEPVNEHPHNELEKVKRSLRKISVSASEKPEAGPGNPPVGLDRVPDSRDPEPFVVLNEEPPEPEPEPLPVPPPEAKPQDGSCPVEPPARETDGNAELNGSENQCSKENPKTRRRKSFPAESLTALPSYMAATESAKAKLRAQAAANAAEDGGENGFVRRHSLPSATGKLSLPSPRVQKPLQNGKGWTKSNKPQALAKDDKMVQTGWKR